MRLKGLKMAGCLLGLLGLMGCGQQESDTLFRLVDPGDSGIHFVNRIEETADLNIINLEYFYNGGGVAVGDFDNDGLEDLLFTANIGQNQLYLNQGNLEFKDITDEAGIAGLDKWKSGVALVDINQDGWLDIYQCASIVLDENARENMLFVNQGLNEDGIPTFKEEAATYGINDNSYTSNAVFLDYDNDGDLDLYLLTNFKEVGVPIVYRPKVNDGTSPNTDKLYRNNGNNTFTDVSAEAGIIFEGHGLGVAVFDVNQDGWQDIYVGNDYLTNDILYVNHGGKFVNEIDEKIRHQSRFSMGNDIADINNDGYQDILTLDMMPENNLRKKTVVSGGRYISYVNDKRYGYAHQYTRNMLQLNNGDGTFSEIGMLSGVYQTEWSWSPLFADFDNDGYRDLIVTNGFPKDITDKDFIHYRQEVGSFVNQETLMKEIPSIKVPNYAFKNDGGLTFEDVTQQWGLDQPSFSNGAAFVDLDKDGDLDYVVNNINSEAFLYENQLYSTEKQVPANSHYLRVNLSGDAANPKALGAMITIRYGDGQIQFHDHSIYRGYISTVEAVAHFGLGENPTVDTLLIEWPNGSANVLTGISADQVLDLSQQEGQEVANAVRDRIKRRTDTGSLLRDETKKSDIQYRQPEYDIIDFNVQLTIPHKYSENGPAIAVGDINGDGLDDFVMGAASGQERPFFIQKPDGTFTQVNLLEGEPAQSFDEGLLLFDADQDGDQDLYIVSGGFHLPEGDPSYQDRLYLNERGRKFVLAENALPEVNSSGSCVRAADYDGDGDLDLFVGGRIRPIAYPFPGRSMILRNDGGTFTDVTDEIAPGLSDVGMVTDALWTDYDGDGKADLMLVGEFMPVTIFRNTGSGFAKPGTTRLEGTSGWWRSLVGADVDHDGDIDYVAGNLGANNHYHVSPDRPLKVFASDYDNNNSVDAILACYLPMEDDSFHLAPVHFWEELNKQSPLFRKRFTYFREFGRATMDSVLTPEEMAQSTILTATHMKTSYLENQGDGTFKVVALPVQAQVAPINGIQIDDINQDGHPDLVMIGNDYGNEIFAGAYDAFQGLVFLGDGNGGFEPMSVAESGLKMYGDSRALGRISTRAGEYFLASQNKDSLRVFAPSKQPADAIRIMPGPQDRAVEITYKDGNKAWMEVYYGAGYLTQSSRAIVVSGDVSEIVFHTFGGETRSVSEHEL